MNVRERLKHSASQVELLNHYIELTERSDNVEQNVIKLARFAEAHIFNSLTKTKTYTQNEIDDAFYSGVISALTVLHYDGRAQLWKEVLRSCADPACLRDYASRTDSLESAGFVDFAREYDALVKNRN